MFLDDLAKIKSQLNEELGIKEQEKKEADKFKELQDEFKQYLDAHLKD